MMPRLPDKKTIKTPELSYLTTENTEYVNTDKIQVTIH